MTAVIPRPGRSVAVTATRRKTAPRNGTGATSEMTCSWVGMPSDSTISRAAITREGVGNFPAGVAITPGIGPPTDKNQCKKGGWKVFRIPEKFKNQGDCVSFVNTEK